MAFYCAFTTTTTTTTSSHRSHNDAADNNIGITSSCFLNLNEHIAINDSWLHYFTSLIKTKSKDTCIFRIKSYKSKFTNATSDNMSESGGGWSSSIGINKLQTTDPLLGGSKHSNKRAMEVRNGFFVDDLDVDNEEEDKDIILRYRYQKDFVLVKDGRPQIVTLCPDWGLPFHFKEISIPASSSPSSVPPPSRKQRNANHKQSSSSNSQSSSGSSWGSNCSLM
ncbi:hypothetical protein SAMD00019534_106430 [Acytostelium subglobosum LB1]|uniref:hypothetical protein n=1 Tax=Acytostelium subglobosum LB1 TaxID=1410327 RepID=UPI000644DEEF|nr:hypothetical protein SAMD00019534_106430 [Acytostelium subglobosum LB1]GAM27467.1 hypothetical protein SAMD00019534_106430 [Acytostelium subglobosum LB1]|eukprot:XP_012749532.1 hypothetical protein SAMD00019534_106430 [Acytostelium subglobosum LB1]